MRISTFPCAIVWRCLRDPMFSRFGTVPVCDRQTDRQTHDDSICRASIASRGKKIIKLFRLLAMSVVHAPPNASR